MNAQEITTYLRRLIPACAGTVALATLMPDVGVAQQSRPRSQQDVESARFRADEEVRFRGDQFLADRDLLLQQQAAQQQQFDSRRAGDSRISGRVRGDRVPQAAQRQRFDNSREAAERELAAEIAGGMIGADLRERGFPVDPRLQPGVRDFTRDLDSSFDRRFIPDPRLGQTPLDQGVPFQPFSEDAQSINSGNFGSRPGDSGFASGMGDRGPIGARLGTNRAGFDPGFDTTTRFDSTTGFDRTGGDAFVPRGTDQFGAQGQFGARGATGFGVGPGVPRQGTGVGVDQFGAGVGLNGLGAGAAAQGSGRAGTGFNQFGPTGAGFGAGAARGFGGAGQFGTGAGFGTQFGTGQFGTGLNAGGTGGAGLGAGFGGPTIGGGATFGPSF